MCHIVITCVIDPLSKTFMQSFTKFSFEHDYAYV